MRRFIGTYNNIVISELTDIDQLLDIIEILVKQDKSQREKHSKEVYNLLHLLKQSC